MIKNDLTYADVSGVLDYDPITGVFRWRVNRGRGVKAGDVAGSHDSQGYRQIGISGRMYLSHRLAFMLMTKAWPVAQIDHINGVKDDNRWSNLRDVYRGVNTQNQRKAQKNSKTGLLGASQDKAGRYQATIKLNGKTRYLGAFNTAEEAHQAYLEAKRKLHEGCTL